MKRIQKEAEVVLKKVQERKEEGRSMENREQSHVKYKKLSIQRTTGKKTSGPICRSIYH